MKAVLVRSVVVWSALSVAAIGCGSSGSTDGAVSTAGPNSSSVTTAGTTTSAGDSTTASSVPATATAIWPFGSSTTRYGDPVQAATGFAVQYLGFVDPVLGTFMQGDSRSGEVAVRATTAGPVTTVIVRRLAPDDTWFVLGASSPHLQLTSPEWNAPVSSPVTVAGRSTAFEATVDVEIRQDGSLIPLATGIVMGGANGEMGPFSKAFPFGRPVASSGAIVLKTMSAQDGHIAEATVVRVRFP